MKYQNRLYVWIKPMDSAGHVTQNMEDVKSLLIKTQETVWLIPEQNDYQTSETTPKAVVFQAEVPDVEVEGISFEIYDIGALVNLQTTLQALNKRIKGEREVDLRLVYSGIGVYDKYDISAETISILLTTFKSVHLEVPGSIVTLPNKNLKTNCAFSIESCAVQVPETFIATLDSFKVKSCSFAAKGDNGIVAVTVKTSLDLQQTTFADNVGFNFQSKNDKKEAWEKCRASVIQTNLLSSSTPNLAASTMSFLNFAQVDVYYFNCSIRNAEKSALGFTDCLKVSLGNFVQNSAFSRSRPWIIVSDVVDFSGDAISDLSRDSFAIGYNSSKLSSVRLTDSKISENGGLINIASEHIDKLVISGINGFGKNSINSRVLTANEILLKDIMVPVDFLSGKTINSLRVTHGTLRGSDIALEGCASVRIEESEIVMDSFGIKLAAGGKITISNSVFSGKVNVEGVPDSNGLPSGSLSVNDLSKFQGNVKIEKMKRVTLERIRIESPSFHVQTEQLGTSYMDVITEETREIIVDAGSLTSLNPSIFRSDKTFNFHVRNSKTGEVNLLIRDEKDYSKVDFRLTLVSCKIPIKVKSERLKHKGSIMVNSTGSLGSSIVREDAVKNNVTLGMDLSSADFPKFRAVGTNQPASSSVFFD